VPGGVFITENLKALVETGKPKFAAQMIMAMGPLLNFTVPKVCRIENWPPGRYE
jgi:hypothetical protein